MVEFVCVSMDVLWSAVVGFCVALIEVEISDGIEVLKFEKLEGLGSDVIVDVVGVCVIIFFAASVVLKDSDGIEVFDSE